MSKIETLVKNGEQIAPRTTTKAVIDEENNTLNDILDDIESEVYEITPFIATYGVTTFAEIYAAYSAGKRVILKQADSDGDIDVYELTEMLDSSYSVGSRRCYFTRCGHSYEIAYIRLKESDNSWSIGSRQIRSIPSTNGNVGKVLSALNDNNEYQWIDAGGGSTGSEAIYELTLDDYDATNLCWVIDAGEGKKFSHIVISAVIRPINSAVGTVNFNFGMENAHNIVHADVDSNGLTVAVSGEISNYNVNGVEFCVPNMRWSRTAQAWYSGKIAKMKTELLMPVDSGTGNIGSEEPYDARYFSIYTPWTRVYDARILIKATVI